MQFVSIGMVVGVFGLQGDIKVKPLVSNGDIFEKLKAVRITLRNGSILDKRVLRVRFHGGIYLIKLERVDTPEDAMYFKKSLLEISSDLLPEPADDEIYWVHIKGFPVVDKSGIEIGELIDFIETGSNDVFVIISKEGKEYLINNNRSHVLEIDTENRRVVIDRIGLVGEVEEV